MPRFVVLRHSVPESVPESARDGSPGGSHWDLMLEGEHDLATWALDAFPGAMATTLSARQLPAHRLAYLTYEGPVSGNRGHVQQQDAGDFVWETRETRVYCVQLQGRRLCGRMTLRRESDDERSWTLHWEPA